MHKIALESFEDTQMPAGQPSTDYAQGHSDGYAAGVDAAHGTQEALKSELVQSISDLEFKYYEARTEIENSLAPLFTTLAEKVFPACISDWFTAQIVTILQQAVTQGRATDFTLSVSPDQVDAMTAALADTTLAVKMDTDSSLSQNAAWIGYDQSELHLNCDQLLADIRAVLSSVDSNENRSNTHG